MPQVIYSDPGDEIVDLVDRVRTSPDNDVALVLNAGARAMQTPLNVRLLRQLASRAGKTVSIISGDPHIQELSRVGGLPTYASVPAFERGIQTVRPHGDDAYPVAAAAGAPALAPPLPPRTAIPAAGAVSTTTTFGRRTGVGRRRPLYFAAAGLVILGLILFLVVAPSAKVTITLAGTPLTVNPTIQGSPDPSNAGQADHIVTSVVNSDQQSQFTATPTGQQQVPATKANATLVFSTDLPNGARYMVPKGDEFDTQDNPPIKFLAVQAADVCVGPNGSQPADCPAGTVNSVPVAEATAEAKGNVGANSITKWPRDPCGTTASICTPSDFTETNPAAASGGADAKTNTVASPDDINKWTAQATQAEQTLTNQVKQDMQNKAAGKTFALDPGGNGTTLACDVTPPLPTANTVMTPAQETVACHGKAAVYNAADIQSDVKADLQQQVVQGDSLATDSINCTKPGVTQAADDGTVVLSVQCTSFSRPGVDLTTLKGQITGKSSGDAKNIIEHRLNHVQNVAISQSPVPLLWLPFFSSRIEIDESFVSQAATGT